jgi:hypothetical protein
MIPVLRRRRQKQGPAGFAAACGLRVILAAAACFGVVPTGGRPQGGGKRGWAHRGRTVE